ncbi:hypothetical protein QL285_056984 [Trifolium repens]|nr:hypothetical protein QL285_056984 [Trifolium repens]
MKRFLSACSLVDLSLCLLWLWMPRWLPQQIDCQVSQKTRYDASILYHQSNHANGNALLAFGCRNYYHPFTLHCHSPSGTTLSISRTTIYLRRGITALCL